MGLGFCLFGLRVWGFRFFSLFLSVSVRMVICMHICAYTFRRMHEEDLQTLPAVDHDRNCGPEKLVNPRVGVVVPGPFEESLLY